MKAFAYMFILEVKRRGANLMSHVELKDATVLIKMLREIGMSYEETVCLLSKSLNEAIEAKKLCRGENKGAGSPLIKLGLTVFLVPVPVISESLGTILMSAGVVQSKVKGTPLQIEDMYETCQRITNELRKMQL
jgi:hypothetical protein